MGLDDRDGAYRSRGQSPRRRSYDDDNASPRLQSGSARDARDMSDPRSRPPRRDYDDGDYANATREPRGSSRGASSNRSDRDEGYDRRAPNANSSPGGRRRPDDRGEGYDQYERPSRSGRHDQGVPSRGERRGGGYERGEGYDRPSRSPRSDPSGSSSRGDRNMRGERPPARDDGWGDPRSSRGGGRGPAGADSNSRMRRPAPQQGSGGRGGRGGLWDDEPGGGLNGGLAGQSARARYLQNQAQQDDDEDESSPAAGFFKGLGAIILAGILGAGAAYGYFVVKAPHLNVPASQQVTPTAPASASPSPSASPTKSALIQPGDGAPYTLIS